MQPAYSESVDSAILRWLETEHGFFVRSPAENLPGYDLRLIPEYAGMVPACCRPTGDLR